MRRIAIAVAVIGVAATACSKKGSLEHDVVFPVGGVTVTSPSLTGSAPTVPTKYTCQGVNTSFPLQWSAPSVTVDTWTLRIDDPDAPGGGFVHWVVENIPAATTTSDEGGSPAGGTVKTAYKGPCPPAGPPHHYVISVTGISKGQPVAKGTLTATYQRQ